MRQRYPNGIFAKKSTAKLLQVLELVEKCKVAQNLSQEQELLKWKESVLNLPKEKHVHIFDFDDTLCKTNGLVKVTETDNDITFFLEAEEYPEWRINGLGSDVTKYDLDFSDFRGYPTKGVSIKSMVLLLRTLLLSESEDLCVLVTGRDELSGPKAWLRNHDVDVDKMILMCSGDPNKRMCYESIISTLEPKQITLYEDCQIYVDQCEEICKKYEVSFTYRLINEK